MLAEITTNCSHSPNGSSFLPVFWPPSLELGVCNLGQAVTCCLLPARRTRSLLHAACTQIGERIQGLNVVLLPTFFRFHMQKQNRKKKKKRQRRMPFKGERDNGFISVIFLGSAISRCQLYFSICGRWVLNSFLHSCESSPLPSSSKQLCDLDKKLAVEAGGNKKPKSFLPQVVQLVHGRSCLRITPH